MKRFASVPARRAAWKARWVALPAAMRATMLGVAGLLLLAVLAGLAFGDRIGEWLWPASRAEALRTQAAQALAEGRLSAGDGSGARELYRAALALQPDQVEARHGLARVALAALAQAQVHAGQGRIAQARIALRLARELQAPKVGLDAVEQDLRSREAAHAGVDALLARARNAHAAGRLDQDDAAALPLYRRVLRLQPRNQEALEGREDALEDLLQPATAALAAGDLATAADRVRRAEAFDPGHAALPELRAGLSRAFEAARTRIRRLLARGQVVAAAEACKRLRAADADAARGDCEGQLATRLLDQAGEAGQAGRSGEMRRLLALARDIGVGEARIAATGRSMRAPVVGRPSPPPSARDHARVTTLLAQAERAWRRGDWLTPPGESAWDRVREARLLAPADPRVAAALATMLPEARRCHAETLRDNDLGRARVCLDAWRQLAPGDLGLAPAQRRLAERWLAIGNERLGAGDVPGARVALERARGIDARAPGIAALAERLQRAQAGTGRR